MARKGIFALEELNEERAEDLVIDESAGAEDLAAADEAAETSGEIEDAAVDASATADALGEIREEVGNSLSEGGMSEPEARALEVAVEHMCAAIGMSTKRKVFPAMEGFADKSSRIANTKIAMESLGERAKEIWAKIIASLQKALEFVKNFFISLFSATKGLKSKADQITKAATGAGGAVTHKVNGGFLGLLTVDGKVAEGEALVSAYEKHVNEPLIKEDRMSILNKAAPEFEKAFAETDPGKAREIASAAVVAAGSELTTGEETPLVFGNQSYFQKVENDRVSVSIGNTTGKTKPSSAVEVTALNQTEVRKLANAVSTHMAEYEKLAAKVTTWTSEFNALINKAKAAISKVGDAKITIQNQVQSLNAMTITGSKLLRSYDVKVSGAVLDYCIKSLKKPAAEKKEVKPAEAKK